ncbi:MAG TPA: type II secretion system F family protein [Verrucomicrobiae bacterium]|jgi:general secretion pathway protein F|nr:type II secretion system F family protein [Verrucomicrobiae bacterium]
MNSFRYQAIEAGGTPTSGIVEAEDRKSALQLLGRRGVFPSQLELCGGGESSTASVAKSARSSGFSFGSGVKRKEITAFTREMSALLSSAIPIPQALDSLGEQEENPALREVVLQIADSLRKGSSFSASLDEHPKLFSRLYASMVRVGEEAGELPKVMSDLAELLEHEDEIRSEVQAAVAYPLFVLLFGIFTVTILLTVVLPRLFGMLQEMLDVLPLPTLILLKVSSGLHHYWPWILIGIVGSVFGIRWYLSTNEGAENWDKIKLQIPVMGGVFRSAALGRFARTLGTLEKSGVSLLPALKIVENTIGNRVLAAQVARVADETRGGDSLAAPLRKYGMFPKTVVQMIDVGEQSGRLDEMLLKVADIEERHMRAKTKTLISLLAPALILVVGSLVGFMVIAILLPIFKMSRAIH